MCELCELITLILILVMIIIIIFLIDHTSINTQLVTSLKLGSEYLALRPEVNVNIQPNARIELDVNVLYSCIWPYIYIKLYSCICRTFTLTSGLNARYSEPSFSHRVDSFRIEAYHLAVTSWG